MGKNYYDLARATFWLADLLEKLNIKQATFVHQDDVHDFVAKIKTP